MRCHVYIRVTTIDYHNKKDMYIEKKIKKRDTLKQ